MPDVRHAPAGGADLAAGRGISADITGAGWHALGHPEMPLVLPVEAGRRLSALAREHDFTLFEYWKTDYAGHAKDMHESMAVLEAFDGMLGGILEAFDRDETLLVITSDHGNIEDLTVKTHTRHPVPLFLSGAGERTAVDRLGEEPDLTGVAPFILEFLGVDPQQPAAAAERP